jgi:hypothetical protein
VSPMCPVKSVSHAPIAPGRAPESLRRCVADPHLDHEPRDEDDLPTSFPRPQRLRMRLDPVFLLAPTPPPPSMPTRRAMLLTGGAFLLGSAIGSACGYTLGVAQAASKPENTDELKPTGDVELDELQRLAVKAPIDELCEKAIPFLASRAADYPQDQILWRGVARLAREMVDNPARPLHHTTIGAVVSTIDRGTPPSALNLRELLPQLSRRREEARRR